MTTLSPINLGQSTTSALYYLTRDITIYRPMLHICNGLQNQSGASFSRYNGMCTSELVQNGLNLSNIVGTWSVINSYMISYSLSIQPTPSAITSNIKANFATLYIID